MLFQRTVMPACASAQQNLGLLLARHRQLSEALPCGSVLHMHTHRRPGRCPQQMIVGCHHMLDVTSFSLVWLTAWTLVKLDGGSKDNTCLMRLPDINSEQGMHKM